MKLKELLEELKKLDPNAEVLVARDPEGNGFAPLYSVDFDEEGGDYDDLNIAGPIVVLWP